MILCARLVEDLEAEFASFSAHLAWRRVSSLVVIMYSKVLMVCENLDRDVCAL